MRFFIPLETSSGLDSLISPHFGRAPYFAVVDFDGRDVRFRIRASPQLMHEAAGCDAGTLIEVSGADAAVVKGIGRKALMMLESMGVKVYYTEANSLREVIEEIKRGSLRPYTMDMWGRGRCGFGRGYGYSGLYYPYHPPFF